MLCIKAFNKEKSNQFEGNLEMNFDYDKPWNFKN